MLVAPLPRPRRTADEAAKETRTTKSFRDAGDRIVRQESALPSPVSRLLGSPAPPVRRAATDAEAWDVRLSALATLGQYDALTFFLAGADSAPAYNLVDDPAAQPDIREAIDEAIRSGATAQQRASVPLADGRVASAVLVSPLASSEASAGAIVALRVGRPFTAVDAHEAVAIAELVSLEIARFDSVRREGAERRQALALYELARHALFADDLGQALENIAMVIASALDHDAAHIWLRGSDGALRRHAAYPPDGPTYGPLWPNDHEALWGALGERRLVRVHGAVPGAWAPSNTGALLVVPLRGDRHPVGVLILARVEVAYRLDDIEMADVLGTFIGRVVMSARREPASAAREGSLSDLDSDEVFAESEDRR